MSWLVALTLLSSPTPPPVFGSTPWRLISTPALHVGVRPAVYIDGPYEVEWGAGATLQVTAAQLSL